MKKKRLTYLRGLALAALALVLAVDAAFLFTRSRGFSPTENRNLQQMPAFSLRGVTSGRFESQFDDYVSDQFPLRDTWIAVKSTVDRLLGRTESGGVFLGGDGYLIQDFTEPSEDDYQATLSALRGFLARHGDIPRYVMIAPTALTVCADKLPALADPGDEAGYLDRLARDLSDTSASMIDLRAAFAALPDGWQLYYRTDHHWTTDGAYIAYLALSDAAGLSGKNTRYRRTLLSSAFSGTLTASSGFRTGETDDLYAYLPVDSAIQCSVTYVGESQRSASVYHAENLENRDQYAVFLGGNHPQIKIETTASNSRALLVLKDSYANCFIPFLVQDYRKIVIVDPRYYTGDLEVLMEAEGINEILILYNTCTFAEDTSLRLDIA